MTEKRVERRLAAILAADVAGYSRLTGVDEEGTVSRLRALRQELIDPVIAGNGGRTVKLMGDGRLVEFGSVVDAVRCAIEVQQKIAVRNIDVAPDRRIEFRVGIHLGDVIVESDGDLMGDGVNIAARLEGIAEPGGICVSEDAWRQVRDKIAEEFADLGDQSLKNIARPMRAYSIVLDGTSEKVRGNSSPATPARQTSPRLSIVVLPFANIGGDPEQDYFVDGVTESLTTDLSRIAGSFVIARNTAFTYKGKAYDVKQIGHELGVRYVLEGSIQRGSNRLRINVQLIDAESGTHLWAERFDKPLADLFDMQDEIVARLARQLDAELIDVEARRAERSPQPDSVDLYFQGISRFQKGATPDNMSRARTYLEHAVSLDSRNIDAAVWSAWMDVLIAGPLFGDDRTVRMSQAESVVTKALSSAPNHAFTHYVFGTVLMWTNRAAHGIAECEHALAINPSLAIARGYVGVAKYFLGSFEETEAHVREALRLSPRDTFAYAWMFIAGVAKLCLSCNEEAVAWESRSLEANRNYPLTHFMLAVALLRLGRPAEAHAAVQAGLTLDPSFTVARFRAGVAGDNPTYLEQRENIIADMRRTGVPEG